MLGQQPGPMHPWEMPSPLALPHIPMWVPADGTGSCPWAAISSLCRCGQQGSTRTGVSSGGDMGLPKPQSGSAGDESVGTQGYNTLLPLYKAGLRSSPSDKTPVDRAIQDTALHLPETGDTYKDTPQPALEKFCSLVIHTKSSAVPSGREMRCTPLPTARILQLWGGGVKATVTLQAPFKDVPFTGAFPSGSHTKGSTTQRDDGAGWAGKPREAAGGLHSARTVLGQLGWGRVTKRAGRDRAVCHGWCVPAPSSKKPG